MADGDVRVSAARRQRVQRLKKCIIMILLAGIAIPFVLSIVLSIQVYRMNRALDRLTGQVQALADLAREQQERLGRLEEMVAREAVTGQGNPVSSDSGREMPEPIQGVLPEEGSEPMRGALPGEESEPMRGALPGEESEPMRGALSGEGSEPIQEEVQGPEVTAAHKVYLTFDDGPSIYTDDILDILDSYGVKATFFVVGKESDTAKEALRDIVERGHTLGMHSYSHKYAEIYASLESFDEDFTKIQDYLYEVTGVQSSVYRFPGGSSNTVSRLDMRGFADYLEERKARFFDWNISSGDGGRRLLSAEELVENCTADIEKYETSVILLHDSAAKSTSVEALPIIIENIQAMEDTVILPITDETEPVQHIR